MASGRIAGGEEVELRRAADELRGAVEDGLNAGSEAEAADGLALGRRVEVDAQGMERVARGQGDVVGFGEVVVFAGQPEDGHGVGRLGALNDGGGFQQGEERAGEEGDLLAGDEGAGALAEALDVGQGLWPGIPAAILLEEQIGDGVAMGGICSGTAVGISKGVLR